MKNITLLLLFISFITFGQNQTVDVLYLKNGSIIKGSITEMNPTTGIKIKTSDGSLFVYTMDEVLKTEKEEFVGEVVNQNTTSTVSQATLDNAFKPNIKSRPKLNFVSISKRNGINKEVDGQKIYLLEYDLLIETNDVIYVNDSKSTWHGKEFLKDFDYYLKQTGSLDNRAGIPKLKVYGPGTKLLFQGTLTFEETENGWRVKYYNNNNYKAVSSNFATKEMGENQKQQLEENKAKLDWSKEDIEPTEFTNRYYLVNDVPKFSYGNVKYTLKKADNFKGRNDVALSVENTLYQAIESTERELKSEESQFTNSENKVNISFTLNTVKFRFFETGYQCEISLIADAEGQYNEPTSISFDYNTTIAAKSNSFKRNMSKEQSLNSALENFKSKVQGFIFQYEPIQIKLKRIELDKRGKVDYVVFEKPAKFINTDKMKFVVMKPSDLKVENNKFTVAGRVGDCTFKGNIEGNEIQCNVSGNKNKKALANYINSDETLIGISSY